MQQNQSQKKAPDIVTIKFDILNSQIFLWQIKRKMKNWELSTEEMQVKWKSISNTHMII